MSIRHRFSAWLELMRRYRAHFSHFWKQRKALTPPPLKTEEAEFLPAVLSLQLAPVSPSGRWTARLLMALIVCLLLWSIFGRVDIIVAATGKIIPSSRAKTIASVETARVEQIFVHDGQVVRAGQPLLVLDTHIIDHEQKRAEVDQDMGALQVARSRALLDSINSGKFIDLHVNGDLPADKLTAARSQLASQWSNFISRLQGLNGQVSIYGMQLPLAVQSAQDYKELAKNHDVSVTAWLEKEQAKLELQGKLSDARNQRDAFIAETRKKTEDELNEGLRQQQEAQEDARRAGARISQLQITAPADGIVQQLGVHTPGGVVTAAQTLMVIVPEQNQIEIEAIVENRDIGFIHQGQRAAVKIDAYDYTKYGMMQGEVTYVSRDAMNAGSDNVYAGAAPDRAGGSEEAHGSQNSQYAVHIRLDEKSMNIDGKPSALRPGMSTSVEIKTGSRRVIEYFLSPLIQHTHESMNER